MRDFLTALIECSVSMSVLAVALLVLTPLISKRYAAKWIYYAWLVIVAGLLIPFPLHFHMEIIQTNAVSPPLQQVFSQNIGSVIATVPQTTTANQGRPAIPWIQIISALWLVGAITFLIHHGLRHINFIRIVKRWGTRVDDPQMLTVLDDAKNHIGISRQVKLQICPCISSPMMIGFRSPIILLPQAGFTADELPYLFRHELTHFKRKDLWYKGLVLLVTAIHWFNPIVYLMAKAIAAQCEISCDAEVVNGIDLEGRQRYSETILKVVKKQSEIRTAFSTNFYSTKVGIKKRIVSIMETKKKKAGIMLLCLIFMGTMGTRTVLAASKNAENGSATSQINTSASILNIAEKWAGTIKTRDGKTQYGLLSPKCQSTVYSQYSSNGWSTGQSSPWVESYHISVGENSATVTYQYATSTGFAGSYEQTLSFVEQNDKFYIDSFSSPREAPQADLDKYDPRVQAFLSSVNGSNFKEIADRFVKAYLIGDIRMMKMCLSNPDSGQNDFSMDGKNVNWKSLTLKLDPQGISENAVSAEYEIALAGDKGFQRLYLDMKMVNKKWTVISYKLEK